MHTQTAPLKLYGQEPHTYARWRDLPPEQSAAFRRWMEDSGGVWRPVIEHAPDHEQDTFYVGDYARWRVDDLHHEREAVVHGEMFTGLIVSVRDIVLALPEENLPDFALQHAECTRCSNLLDVFTPTPEMLALSASYYLRQFRGWREEVARGNDDAGNAVSEGEQTSALPPSASLVGWVVTLFRGSPRR